MLAIRAERHAKRILAVTLKAASLFRRRDIPHPDVRPIATGHCEPLSVGAAGHSHPEGRRGLEQGAHFPGTPEVPYPNRPIRASGNEGAPVRGMEDHVGDRTRVATERQIFRARLRSWGSGVPDADGPIDACRGELVAVGAEGHAKDVVDV